MTIIAIAALMLLGALFFLVRVRVLSAIGGFLLVEDGLQPADVIHVVSGLDHRTDYAIQLYKQGYGWEIFFTGGYCHLSNDKHANHARNRAIEQGIPAHAVFADVTEVTSTYAEAVRLKEFIANSPTPIHSVIIVSDPHHMWRSRWAYREVLGEKIKLTMAPVPFELTPYKRCWWNDEKSRRMVSEEYAKIVYYYARYRYSWGPVKEWLASFDQY